MSIKKTIVESLVREINSLTELAPDVSPNVALRLGQIVSDFEVIKESVIQYFPESREVYEEESKPKRVINFTSILDLDSGYIFVDGGNCPICNGKVRKINLNCQEREDGMVIHPFYLECSKCKKLLHSHNPEKAVVSKVKRIAGVKRETSKKERIVF